MCAVTDIGFAQSLVKKLAAAEPEIYGAAAEALDLKAKRARERKEEQLQHEKNLRQGQLAHEKAVKRRAEREAAEAEKTAAEKDTNPCQAETV